MIKVGLKFGKLTVVEFAGKDKYRNDTWRCLCTCFQFTVVRSSTLRIATDALTCGCCKRTLQHQKEYHAWEAAKQRCYNPANPRYKDYGARGITMCAEWLNDFPAFLAHIGEAPGKFYLLDRIENDKGYEFNNVRWATYTESNNNRR